MAKTEETQVAAQSGEVQNIFKYFKGSFGMPYLGSTLKFIKSPAVWASSQFIKYGSIFKTHLLLEKMIVISDPEVAKFIMRQENKLVRVDWPKPTQRLLGAQALTAVHGTPHEKLRQLLTGAFQPSMLDSLCPIVNEIVDRFLSDWSKMKAVPNMNIYIRNITLTITQSVVLGTNSFTTAEFNKMRDDLIVYTMGLFALPINFPGTAYNKALKARTRIIKTIQNRITVLRKEMAEAEEGAERATGYTSILEKLIATIDEDAGVNYKFDTLPDNSLVLLFAGMDTSSSTITSLITILNYRTDVMEKIREEQDRIVAEYGEEITPEIVNKMEYLNAVFWDFFQAYPIIGNSFRVALEDFQLPGYNATVAKGQKVAVSFHGQHFHHNPEEGLLDFSERFKQLFNPDKTFKQLKNGDDTGKTWAPFGQGKRRCVGEPLANLVIRVFMAKLARGYKHSIVGSKEPPAFGWFPVPRPLKPLKMKFTKRN